MPGITSSIRLNPAEQATVGIPPETLGFQVLRSPACQRISPEAVLRLTHELTKKERLAFQPPSMEWCFHALSSIQIPFQAAFTCSIKRDYGSRQAPKESVCFPWAHYQAEEKWHFGGNVDTREEMAAPRRGAVKGKWETDSPRTPPWKRRQRQQQKDRGHWAYTCISWSTPSFSSNVKILFETSVYILLYKASPSPSVPQNNCSILCTWKVSLYSSSSNVHPASLQLTLVFCDIVWLLHC